MCVGLHIALPLNLTFINLHPRMLEPADVGTTSRIIPESYWRCIIVFTLYVQGLICTLVTRSDLYTE